MADIAKCNGHNCPLKEKCYRYTVPASDWQTYGDFKYDDGCDYFWDNSER